MTTAAGADETNRRPIILVTNDDGISAPGLRALVSCLVASKKCQVFVCAPDQERSGVAHALTTRDTIEVGSVDIPGATAYEVSGTPVDCMSLALGGPLLGGIKPTLVVSGINKGSNAGLHVVYSGTVGGAREAFIFGIPSIALSLDWKFDGHGSVDDDFAAAASVCVPIVLTCLADIAAGSFPSGCFLNVDVPFKPLENRGIKITRQGKARFLPRWTVLSSRRTAAQMAGPRAGGMAIGAQLAQLGLAASAAGAARRVGLRQTRPGGDEVETSGEQPAAASAGSKQHFRLDLGDYENVEVDADVDCVALRQGWITITPLSLMTQSPPGTILAVEAWASSALATSPL